VALQAQSGGGTWTGAGIVNAALGTFNPQQAPAGANTVIYEVTQNGCYDADTVVISVNQAPDATITSAPSEVCSNAPSVNLGSLFPGGVWTGPGISDSVAGILDPGAMVPGNNTITYSITQQGCTDSKTAVVQWNQAPNATILSNPGIICDNDVNLQLIAVSPGGIWTGPGIVNASNGTFSPSFSGTGTATITYAVSSGNCFDNDTIQLAVAAAPILNVTPSGPQEACAGSSLTLSASGAVNYQWTVDGTVMPGEVSSNLNVVNSGNYAVEGDDGVCSAVIPGIPVTINPLPQVLALDAIDVCFGTQNTFGAVAVVAQNTGSVVSGYSWNFGDGTSGTGLTPAHTYQAPGAYQVSLVVNTNQGCTDTLVQTVQVNALPVITAATAPNVCEPFIAQFQAQASVSGASIATYQWNFGNGFSGTGQQVSHLYPNPGPYTWMLTVTSDEGCSETQTGTIQVYQQPQAGFIANNVCTDIPAQFIDVSNAFGDQLSTWAWDFGDGSGSSNMQNPTYQYNVQAGTYPVSLTVTTASGCSNTSFGFVDVSQSPNAQWVAQMGTGYSVNFAPVNPNPNVTFIWHFPEDNTYFYQTQVQKTFPGSGDFDVCMTAEQNGCSVTECGTVSLTPLSQEDWNGETVRIYPNPVQDDFVMELPGSGKVELRIFDLSGRLLLTRDYVSDGGAIHVSLGGSGIPAGSYLLELKGELRSWSSRMVKIN
jgi:PKD repeat protein